MYGKAKLLPLALLSLLAAGCSNINPEDAVKLSGSGQAFVSTSNSTYQSSRDGLNKYLESEAISAAFLDRPDVGDATISSILDISKQLAARKAAFDKLGATYKAFGDLASYDAAKEVENRINGLSGALNEYAKAVGSNHAAVSGVTDLIISKGGGMIASQAQKDQLKEASSLIRVRLGALSEILTKDIARMKRYKSEELRARMRATDVFIGEGLGDPGKMATGYLSDVGLSSSSDGVDYWSAEVRKSYIGSLIRHRNGKGPEPALPPAYSAMKKYVVIKSKSEAGTQDAILDEIKSSVDELIGLHVEFEAGKELSVTSITQSIVLLQQLLKEYQAAKSKDEA